MLQRSLTFIPTSEFRGSDSYLDATCQSCQITETNDWFLFNLPVKPQIRNFVVPTTRRAGKLRLKGWVGPLGVTGTK